MERVPTETVTEPVVPQELDSRFEGYDATIKRMRTTDTDVVFLIDRDRANSTRSSPGR